jgi:hypothetical protein
MKTRDDYAEFLAAKEQNSTGYGFDPVWMPDSLYGFQQHLVEWNLWKGRSALFADCGMGKTPVQLTWAENVVRKTNGRVLVLTPCAVASQTVREGQKFGIDCLRSRGEQRPAARIEVTNYEKLHLFDPDDYMGVVCDESSAIKAFNGKRRAEVTEFLRTIPYRLLCTATAAPNDYTELGTSSEALGELGFMDMLGRFFVNDQNNTSTKRSYAQQGGGTPKFRFKGHAEIPFWRWVASWAKACRKPSDLGYPDDGFILPPLVEREHVVEARALAPGMLFPMAAVGMREEREERRRTLAERCEKVAELVDHDRPAVIWCHLNPEGDLLAKLIPGARQVRGSTPDDEKEEIYDAFSSGRLRVLVLKPKIGAWGLNWQHCAHVVTFASHSYEQYYQAVRRCWRFGQRSEVVVDHVVTEGEAGIRENIRRKSEAANRMFAELVHHMNAAARIEPRRDYSGTVEVPSWL